MDFNWQKKVPKLLTLLYSHLRKMKVSGKFTCELQKTENLNRQGSHPSRSSKSFPNYSRKTKTTQTISLTINEESFGNEATNSLHPWVFFTRRNFANVFVTIYRLSHRTFSTSLMTLVTRQINNMNPVKDLTRDESQLLGDLSTSPVLRKPVMDSMLVRHTFVTLGMLHLSHFIIITAELKIHPA